MMKIIQPLSEEFLYLSPERISSAFFRLRFHVRGKKSILVSGKVRGEVTRVKRKKR